ncbi:hypothetical protein [Staphylococcus caprae]|uniref:hypothetical protein n=1 Tax=Staphylococcus caprae TaxID=29380 RepID=UPI003B21F559
MIKSDRGNVNQGTKYYPCCPVCEEPFELKEITDNWKGGIFVQQQLINRINKAKDKEKR